MIRVNDEIEKFKQITANMNIPKQRRELNRGNIFWLNRNLWLQNQNHPNLPEAKSILKSLIRSINTWDMISLPADLTYDEKAC